MPARCAATAGEIDLTLFSKNALKAELGGNGEALEFTVDYFAPSAVTKQVSK